MDNSIVRLVSGRYRLFMNNAGYISPKINMKAEIIMTTDGSSSIYLPAMDETYHSKHGAITESNYVFIKNRLNYYIEKYNTDSINILEVGFGTGLNALLSADYAIRKSVNIKYYTIELYPLESSITKQLNYQDLLPKDSSKDIFERIHQSNWGTLVPINKYFSLCKINHGVSSFQSSEKFDAIYYDAFAPSKQPEMWKKNIFNKLKSMMNPNGILVTYCAQGQFKRNLKNLNFKVESLPGPPKKFEMIRACINFGN